MLLGDAEALVASGRAEWVGGKHKAVTPTPRATDRGYDAASGHRLTTFPAKLGICKCCGAGSFKRVCNRCQLDRDNNLDPNPSRWEHNLGRSTRVPESV
jgi:hypothetical protein